MRSRINVYKDKERLALLQLQQQAARSQQPQQRQQPAAPSGLVEQDDEEDDDEEDLPQVRKGWERAGRKEPGVLRQGGLGGIGCADGVKASFLLAIP